MTAKSPEEGTMMTLKSVVFGEGSLDSSLNYTKTAEFEKLTPTQKMKWRK